jgi:hypothetical protein
MKWLGMTLVVLLVLVVLAFAVGALLPREHTAAVRVQLRQPPQRVYATIADVSAAPTWREELNGVEVLSPPGQPLRWRETGKFGELTFVRDEDVPGRRIVARIDDTSQGFGGTWTYAISPADSGSVLTITEQGVVYNPLFRFMSRFVFGHYATLETYARSLATRFGEPARVERAGDEP